MSVVRQKKQQATVIVGHFSLGKRRLKTIKEVFYNKYFTEVEMFSYLETFFKLFFAFIPILEAIIVAGIVSVTTLFNLIGTESVQNKCEKLSIRRATAIRFGFSNARTRRLYSRTKFASFARC